MTAIHVVLYQINIYNVLGMIYGHSTHGYSSVSSSNYCMSG